MMFLLLGFPLLQYLLTYEYFFVFQGRIVGNDPVGLFLHQLKLEVVVFHPDQVNNQRIHLGIGKFLLMLHNLALFLFSIGLCQIGECLHL